MKDSCGPNKTNTFFYHGVLYDKELLYNQGLPFLSLEMNICDVYSPNSIISAILKRKLWFDKMNQSHFSISSNIVILFVFSICPFSVISVFLKQKLY